MFMYKSADSNFGGDATVLSVSSGHVPFRGILMAMCVILRARMGKM